MKCNPKQFIIKYYINCKHQELFIEEAVIEGRKRNGPINLDTFFPITFFITHLIEFK